MHGRIYFYQHEEGPVDIGGAKTLEEAASVILEHAEQHEHEVSCFVDDHDGEGLVADANTGRYRFRLPHAWPDQPARIKA